MHGQVAAAKKPARILVVDDSPTVLGVIEAVLVGAGHEVTCLDSGAAVIDAARRSEPELIFVDFAMPEVNGFAVCRCLGEHPELETIPIVLMNTRGDAVGERFVREMGIVDHITKPFAPEVLLAVVEHTLDKTRAMDPEIRRRHSSSTSLRQPEPDLQAAARHQLACELAERLRSAPNAEPTATLERAFADPDILAAMRAAVGSGGVGLAGDLSAVPIAEVLQLLALQRQTGVLRVRHGSAEIAIALERGTLRLVTGAGVPQEFLLGNILLQEQLVDRKDLDLVLGSRHGGHQRLGTQLVKLGYLSQQDLHRALHRQSTELVYELLRGGAGHFAFTPAESLPPELLELEFDIRIDQVLMEGFRRVDEWGLIEAAIPSFDLVPVRIPGGPERLGDPGLTASEETVLAAVDGTRTVHEIIDEVGLGSYETARRLYRLVAARVVASQA